MARRPGEDGGFRLSPRDRRAAGWIAAGALLVGIAVAVRVLGGNGDGSPIAPEAGTSPSTAPVGQITFGTALDDTTGEVAADAHRTSFTATDAFAYSIPAQGPVPGTVYVEVERTGGGPHEVVQPAVEDGLQPVPEGSQAIAFTVPASRLLEAFGPGEYRMRIFVDPTGEPLGEGAFALAGVDPSGSSGSSPTP